MRLRMGPVDLFRVAVFVAAAIVGGSTCAANTIPNLGAAADFGLLGLNNADYSIQNSLIVGDIGVGQGGTASNSSGAVFGDAIQYSSGQITNGGFISGSITVDSAEMTAANSGAISAYSTAVANTATQSFGPINSSTMINGNGGLNVVNISSVNLNNGTITLNGTSSDIFVLRVSGNFKLSGNSGINLGTNVSASQVLIVFTGTGTTINIATGNNTTINGTLLAPSASTNWQITGGVFNGEIITGTPDSRGRTPLDLSNVFLSAAPFRPVPEPSSVILAGVGTVCLASLMRRQRQGVQ